MGFGFLMSLLSEEGGGGGGGPGSLDSSLDEDGSAEVETC